MTPNTILQHAEAEARRIAYESGDPGANNPRAVLALLTVGMIICGVHLNIHGMIMGRTFL